MHLEVRDTGVQLTLPYLGVLPKLTEQPLSGVGSLTPDGAYYKTLGDYAQVIVIGPMHFSPSSYLEAINDLLDERFEHYHNAFLDPVTSKNVVLQRGFISLHFKKP